MCEEFLNDLVNVVESHIFENNEAFVKTITMSEYWQGRLFESEDLKKDLCKLFDKYELNSDSCRRR